MISAILKSIEEKVEAVERLVERIDNLKSNHKFHLHYWTEIAVISILIYGIDLLKVDLINGLATISIGIFLSWFKHKHLRYGK